MLTQKRLTLHGNETRAIEIIRYNAKGQKELIALGNGTHTEYEYDPQMFRLRRIRTFRQVPAGDQCSSAFVDPAVVQDLQYTYDAIGNVVQILDAAQATTTFGGQSIDATNQYEYDALYRLTLATGRENGAATGAPTSNEAQAVSRACAAPDPPRYATTPRRFATTGLATSSASRTRPALAEAGRGRIAMPLMTPLKGQQPLGGNVDR